jgi:RND family efflux transporter MFP subunit
VIRKTPFIFFLLWTAAHSQSVPVPVVVEPVVLADASDEISLTGTATARRTSMISPFSDGLVMEMRVDIGDSVAAGQVLARLDDVIAGHELATAAASLEQARAELRDAIRRREEAARVHADNLIAGSVYESAVAEADIRQAAMERLESEYARQAEIVSRHTVLAPFAGVIAGKFAEEGQWAQRSQALFELVETRVLRIDVQVPQTWFGSVIVGTPATVRFDALTEGAIETVVTTLVPISDPSARTFLVRLDLDNNALTLTPGMSARVILRPGTTKRNNALHVPRDALERMDDGNYRLWLVDKQGGVVVSRPATVTVLRFSGRFAVIAEGAGTDTIAAGDQAIVRGNESLKPGDTIRIVKSGS